MWGKDELEYLLNFPILKWNISCIGIYSFHEYNGKRILIITKVARVCTSKAIRTLLLKRSKQCKNFNKKNNLNKYIRRFKFIISYRWDPRELLNSRLKGVQLIFVTFIEKIYRCTFFLNNQYKEHFTWLFQY